MSDTDKEQRIRERAYQLWKAEGEQHGQSDEYWARAVAMEPEPAEAPATEPAKSPAKSGTSKAKSPASKPAVEAPAPSKAEPKTAKRTKAPPAVKK